MNWLNVITLGMYGMMAGSLLMNMVLLIKHLVMDIDSLEPMGIGRYLRRAFLVGLVTVVMLRAVKVLWELV